MTALRATLHTSISIGFSLHARFWIYLPLGKKVGEENIEGQKKKIKEGVNTEVQWIWTDRQTKLLSERKLKGEKEKEEENRKDVATEHMSSQETCTFRECYDHCCVCACVGVRVCVSQYVVSVWTITQFIYDGSPLTVAVMENLLTTLTFLLHHHTATHFWSS